MAKESAMRAADVVLHGGNVITVNARFEIAEAVAITGNRIAYVGANASALALADGRTQVIDLKGRTVMPGLIDGHAHMDREGLKQVFPSLANARSVADVKARIADKDGGETESVREAHAVRRLTPALPSDLPSELAVPNLTLSERGVRLFDGYRRLPVTRLALVAFIAASALLNVFLLAIAGIAWRESPGFGRSEPKPQDAAL